jgi:hypothetical protein
VVSSAAVLKIQVFLFSYAVSAGKWPRTENGAFETSVTIYLSTLYNIPEDLNVQKQT